MQKFGTQTKMLKMETDWHCTAYANVFSTMILISFSVVACVFQFYMTDANQGLYFIYLMLICFFAVPLLWCLICCIQCCCLRSCSEGFDKGADDGAQKFSNFVFFIEEKKGESIEKRLEDSTEKED